MLTSAILSAALLSAAPAPDPIGPGLVGPHTARPVLTAATLYSVVPGYGLGHFLLGDEEAGMRFLALDLGATALWLIGPSVVALAEGPAMGSAPPSLAAQYVFSLGIVAQGALKVWEVWSASQAADSPDP